MDLPKRYHPAIVILHWLVASLVFINLFLGLIIYQNGSNRLLTGIHMIVGMSVLVLVCIRLVVRLSTKLPPDATIGNKYLDILGKLVHYALYLMLLVITVIGVWFAVKSGRLQNVLLNAPLLTVLGGGGLNLFGVPLLMIHMYAAWLLVALVFGHVSAALYHQFVRRDHLIARMSIARK